MGTFPGSADGQTLVFCAHYDTTTHFGDHFSWGAWGRRQGPATALAVALPALGLWRRRRGKRLPRALALPLAGLSVVPFAAMFWFQAVGPLVREPSPGALDNGGSVAALTDGRSFLAHGIPAITLRAFTGDEFPRGLHSAHDSRDRLSLAAIERSTDLLYAMVERADSERVRLGDSR